MIKKGLSGLLGIFLLLPGIYSQNEFDHWPAGASPAEVGNKITARFLKSPHGIYGGDSRPHIPYFEVCTWYGALTFCRLTKNETSRNGLIERFIPLFKTDSALLPVPDHVDYTVFGAIPLEIHLQQHDNRYLQMGLRYADKQWGAPEGPRVTPASWDYYNRGLTWQTRMWIDDMYMISLVQAQAFRVTKNKKYIERAAREMVMYLDSLQKSNGLFYHAPDTPFFWGRGNGWMAAGMTELLRVLPKNNPHYARIMRGYTTMMSAILKYQADDGMWRQLVDDIASWKETSCTGMFAYAMITGVKNGWLNKKIFSNPARKAWLVLITYINENGETTNVCEGTGKKNDRQYYLDRKKLTGDMHGQAPILWCASALLRKKNQ